MARRRNQLGFEALERRNLMAVGDPLFLLIDGGWTDPLHPPGGNVTAEVIDGVLKVRGDSAGNQIEIYDYGNGTVSITGLNGTTTVNGQVTRPSACEVKFFSLSGVTDGIDIDTGDGDDIVWLKGRELPRVTIVTGDGNDQVSLGGLDPQYGCAQTNSIKFPVRAGIFGNLLIDTGDGNDVVLPYAAVKGNAEIHTGLGADQIIQSDLPSYGLVGVDGAPIVGRADLQVVGTTIVDLGPDPAGSGDVAPANLGRLLSGPEFRILGRDPIAWSKPYYPAFETDVVDSFQLLDAVRSRVTAHTGSSPFTFDEIGVLGWPKPLLRNDGTILIDITYSHSDPSFLKRLTDAGIVPADSLGSGHISAWVNLQQLHALLDVEGLQHVSLQTTALIGPQNSLAPVRCDVNSDAEVNAGDVMIVINALNQGNDVPLTSRTDISVGLRVDVNGDGVLTAADALQIINLINANSAAAAPASAATAEGESSSANDDLQALAADEYYRQLVSPRRNT